jgi:hypothetical protein
MEGVMKIKLLAHECCSFGTIFSDHTFIYLLFHTRTPIHTQTGIHTHTHTSKLEGPWCTPALPPPRRQRGRRRRRRRRPLQRQRQQEEEKEQH